MSTISDALRKAQKQRTDGGQPRPEPPVTHFSPVPDSRYRRSPWGAPMAILIGALAAALVLAIGFSVMRLAPNRAPAPVVSAQAAPASPSPVLAPEPLPPRAPAVAETTANPLPAPPEPVAPPSPPMPKLPTLTGIFYSERNPVAIINGYSLKEGETVGGFRIGRIMAERVILTWEGREIELRL